MKKHTEKQPIDELFARKLSDMSLTPGNDAWNMLQERMGTQTSRRVIPVWSRYAAAAACFLLVSTVGWQYWRSATVDSASTSKNVVATVNHKRQSLTNKIKQVDETKSKEQNVSDETLAYNKELLKTDTNQEVSSKRIVKPTETIGQEAATGKDERIAKIIEIPEPKSQPEPMPKSNEPVAIDEKRVASVETNRADEQLERKLIVVINPPAVSLSNQAMPKTESLLSALTEEKKDGKHTKAGRLFKKLKQLKDGEAFAYDNNTSDEEENGLISRLYGNVKHSIDSKKVDKQ